MVPGLNDRREFDKIGKCSYYISMINHSKG